MMAAGIRGHGRAATYIAQTCFLADKMHTDPRVLERTWSRKSRELMLAYYEAMNNYRRPT